MAKFKLTPAQKWWATESKGRIEKGYLILDNEEVGDFLSVMDGLVSDAWNWSGKDNRAVHYANRWGGVPSSPLVAERLAKKIRSAFGVDY